MDRAPLTSPLPHHFQTASPGQRSSSWGIILLAGGEGSRIQAKQPKGTLPLSAYGDKTLFELFFTRLSRSPVPVAMLTSPMNHQATWSYLKAHHFFTFPRKLLFSFQQSTRPIHDLAGRPLFHQGRHIQAPDGNGGTLFHFYTQQVYHSWEKLGISQIQIVPIDNPLAPLPDRELFGLLETDLYELVLRSIERTPLEEIGAVGIVDNALTVQEYSELSLAESQKLTLGNSALWGCRLDWVKKVHRLSLPWHRVQRYNLLLNKPVDKQERFIYDLFPHARTFAILQSQREGCFAPIKRPPSFQQTDSLPL